MLWCGIVEAIREWFDEFVVRMSFHFWIIPADYAKSTIATQAHLPYYSPHSSLFPTIPSIFPSLIIPPVFPTLPYPLHSSTLLPLPPVSLSFSPSLVYPYPSLLSYYSIPVPIFFNSINDVSFAIPCVIVSFEYFLNNKFCGGTRAR